MNKKEIHNLIYFFNHNKSLTRAQILKRDELFTRDYMILQEVSKSNKSGDSDENKRNLEGYHRPKEMTRFLKSFSSNKLKFTTHLWDLNEIENFDDFCMQYSDAVKSDPLWPDLYKCNPQVYWLIYNYLFNEGTDSGKDNRFWSSKCRIKVGIQNPKGVMSDWLKEHPGKQMFDLPLSVYKNGFMEKGTRIRGKLPVYFYDIADLFKHCIEFRDADFYSMLRRVFCNSDFEVDMASLKKLRGITFFTSTELIEEALEDIANNIRSRLYNSNKVEIWRERFDGYEELHVLHRNSFALSDIDNDKLMLRLPNSQLSRIKKKLQSLCDFYIISTFVEKGTEVDARIDYLKNENVNVQPQVTYLEQGSSKGFECVLRFYN